MLPVLGVPVESQALKGMDSLLSIVQMPAGDPGGHAGDRQGRRHERRAPGRRDPRHHRPDLREKLRAYRKEQTAKVKQDSLP